MVCHTWVGYLVLSPSRGKEAPMAVTPDYLLVTRNCRAPRRMVVSSAQSVAEDLARRMADAWAEGQPLSVEAVLAEHPELSQQPQAVVRLIFEEYLQAREAGKIPYTDSYLQRFPDWSS